MLLLISYAFLNKQAEGIILSNHSLQQVASDSKTGKPETWNPVLNLKPKAEKFEERVTVKIIIERIIKALLKGKIFIVSN